MKSLTPVAFLLCALTASRATAQANLGRAAGDKACLTALADADFAALVAHHPTKHDGSEFWR